MKMNNEIVVDGVTYVKKEVEVKYWEGLKGIEGYYISNHSDIHSAENAETHKGNRNVWATKEQAEACLAMSQLSQLLKDVNGDWVPDEIYDSGYPPFLVFKTPRIKYSFMKTHKELIKQARPLL
jgi:hypothetical protein